MWPCSNHAASESSSRHGGHEVTGDKMGGKTNLNDIQTIRSRQKTDMPSLWEVQQQWFWHPNTIVQCFTFLLALISSHLSLTVQLNSRLKALYYKVQVSCKNKIPSALIPWHWIGGKSQPLLVTQSQNEGKMRWLKQDETLKYDKGKIQGIFQTMRHTPDSIRLPGVDILSLLMTSGSQTGAIKSGEWPCATGRYWLGGLKENIQTIKWAGW